MFSWDGSEVTHLIKDCDIEEAIYVKTIYWKIINKNQEEICMIRPMSNGTLSCLIDEIKPIFSLQKIGTHWIKYNNKKLILLKVNLNAEGCVIFDLTLDLLPYKEKLAHEVRKIFVFRELLGMSKSYDTSIILKKAKREIIPISFYEPNMVPSCGKSPIPKTVLEKWFKDVSIDEMVKKMLKIDSSKEIVNVLYKLRLEIEKVVERCDRNSITFVDEILSRVGARLQYIL
jgi:hypothetical protein